MVGIHGERLYGQVDRVPGLFYVSTQFLHVNYVPLIPLRSYIVIEGSEDGENFRGKKVPLKLKSVLVGYLRGWLAAITLFCAFVSGMAGTAFFIGHTEPASVLAGLAAAGGLAWCFWFVIMTPRRIFLWAEALLLAFSAALWIGCKQAVEQNPALAQAKGPEVSYLSVLLVANATALLFNFTRLLAHGTYDRALVLAEELGIARELVEAHLGEGVAGVEGQNDLDPYESDANAVNSPDL
jgi:hypothetical protein